MMYAIHLIENDMADTTSIINSTVSFYFYVPTVVYIARSLTGRVLYIIIMSLVYQI